MPLGRIDEETSANIGSFEGKGPTNIVCDKVEIAAEARSIREHKLQRQLETMRECFEETARSFGAGVRFESEITPGFLSTRRRRWFRWRPRDQNICLTLARFIPAVAAMRTYLTGWESRPLIGSRV